VLFVGRVSIEGDRVKYFILAMLLILLTGCYQTENGIVFGKPAYEKRDISVTEVDLKILELADQLLSTEASWSNDNGANCNTNKKYSLLCALHEASVRVVGTYEHRRAALQEVRFAIDDFYKNYWQVHRLRDFNSNSKTTFSNIKFVIKEAKIRTKNKLAKNA
jgi:hypothetical protein